jgi:hypothetical protein
MRDESAIGPGLPNPVYPKLVPQLADGTVPDEQLAFVLAVCSSYAYGDPDALATIMDRLGMTRNRCRMISEYVDALFLTCTAYLIQSEDGRVAILCYRGTPPTSLITWVTDLQVEPVRIPVSVPVPSGAGATPRAGMVHGGFYRNVRSTRFRIVQLLRDAIEDEGLQVIYITGHSLGGASAALLPVLLEAEPSPYGGISPETYQAILARVRAVYTYGSPMIGDRAFADACTENPALRGKVRRYVYANDVVPRLPPRASGRFKHFGTEYRYWPPGSDGHWRKSPRPRKQISNIFQLATAPLAIVAKTLSATRHLRFRASLSDHFPQYYIDALAPEDLRTEFGD